MGALWRSHDVLIAHESAARAVHNSAGSDYGLSTCDSLIYANLFDALLANRNLPRAVMYDVLGFAASAKGELSRLTGPRDLTGLKDLVAAWCRGHVQLARDWRYLAGLVDKLLPDAPS